MRTHLSCRSMASARGSGTTTCSVTCCAWNCAGRCRSRFRRCTGGAARGASRPPRASGPPRPPHPGGAARRLADHTFGLTLDGQAQTVQALLRAFPAGACQDDPELALVRANGDLVEGRLDDAAAHLAV